MERPSDSNAPDVRRALSAILTRPGPPGGRAHLAAVLLDVEGSVSLLEHVITDPHGVLVVEARDWAGERLRGCGEDPSWTALRAGHAAAGYPNPLPQNEARVEQLRTALASSGVRPDLVQVSGIVVLPDLDLAELDLQAFQRARIARVSEVEEILAARQTPPAEDLALSADEIARVSAAIGALDRSGDPSVRRRHEDQVAVRVPPPAAPPASARQRNPVVLVAVAAGVVLLAAGALTGVLLLASRGTGASPGPVPVAVPTVTPEPPDRAPVAPVDEAPSPSVDIPNAKRLLRIHQPGAYARISDLDDPDIDRLPDRLLYTWEYVDAGGSSARIRKVTIAVLANGTYGGLDRDR